MMDARWLRPLGVGEVIDAALKIYRARFMTMLKAVAVVVIPVQLINVIVVLSLPDVTTTRTTSNGFTTTQSTGNGGAVIAALLVVQMVTILSSLVATAACLKVVSDAYLGTVTTWRESAEVRAVEVPVVGLDRLPEHRRRGARRDLLHRPRNLALRRLGRRSPGAARRGGQGDQVPRAGRSP